MIILEDELEKLASSKETQSMTTEASFILEEKLRLIQPHVQASNTCWEEALCQVERMVRRPPAIKGIIHLCCTGFIYLFLTMQVFAIAAYKITHMEFAVTCFDLK